jgi:hypothetical protein
MTRRLSLAFALACLAGSLFAQGSEHFNLYLRADYSSAERTLELCSGLSGRPDQIARMPGSRIALATTALLTQKTLTEDLLTRSLEELKFNQSLDDDPFKMSDLRANLEEIRQLLLECERRNFSDRVVATVSQLFPAEARVEGTIPVYFVAFGYQNVDAFVRRVVWRNGFPVFVGEGSGELTIVVNLSRAVHYGRTTDERLIGMLSVVAHEVFHAAFGIYKDGSAQWRSYAASHTTPADDFIDLAQNEGIAYYLSLVQSSRGRLPGDAKPRVDRAFSLFNSVIAELLSPRTSPGRAGDLIRLSNSSGYWDNYGAITGMIVARQIDQTLGRQALTRTIATGPADFFLTYADLARRDDSLPQLSGALITKLQSGR